MTVLGTASKVYVGAIPAVAVYAGSVKVWPSPGTFHIPVTTADTPPPAGPVP